MKKVIIRLLLVTIVARAYIDNRAAQAQTIAVDSSRAKAASRGPGRDTLFPVVSDPKPLTPLMERELRGCFDFFWNEWISDPASPTYGMTAGDYVGLHSYSPVPVEEQGFYFAAIVIGVERGWISREDGEKRILITLNSPHLKPSGEQMPL